MTVTSTDYITAQEYLDYIKSTGDTDNPVVSDAIAAASREINSHCGRFFYQTADTAVRYLSADVGTWMLHLGDFDIPWSATPTIETTWGNDGTYPDAWVLDTDFIREPVNRSRNGIADWPVDGLRAVNGNYWPWRYTPYQRPTIRITSPFGWDEVPDPVKQACKILVAQSVKLGDAALGVAGYGAFGDIRVREIPQAAKLLAPYVKGSSFGVA